MDYYANACEQLEGAEILYAAQKYRLAVTLLCLSGELFLKSLVERKDPESPLLNSHDIVNLGNIIRDDVDYTSIAPKLSLLRKFLNDSRYPFDFKIYTKEFYNECLNAVTVIRFEIDNANSIKSDIERLRENFGKDKVIDKRE